MIASVHSSAKQSRPLLADDGDPDSGVDGAERYSPSGNISPSGYDATEPYCKKYFKFLLKVFITLKQIFLLSLANSSTITVAVQRKPTAFRLRYRTSPVRPVKLSFYKQGKLFDFSSTTDRRISNDTLENRFSNKKSVVILFQSVNFRLQCLQGRTRSFSPSVKSSKQIGQVSGVSS